jgi:quinol monooxygenase YgiN
LSGFARRELHPARIPQYVVGMIVGTLRILPKPDRRDEILKVFRSIQGPVLAQPGCAACHIYEEHGPQPAVVLVERWESDAALEAHLRSEAYRRVLAAIELSGGPPEVCFDYVSATEGIDRIERARDLSGQAETADRAPSVRPPPPKGTRR